MDFSASRENDAANACRLARVGEDHIVHCERAPALHVERIDHYGWAVVYACRTFYHWRLPHAR